jgi:hypothetical protein
MNPGLLPRPTLKADPPGFLSPPALQSVPQTELIQHSVNDLMYVSPPEGKVCWAVIPCTTWLVLPTLRLLDPRRGIAGGIGRGS